MRPSTASTKLTESALPPEELVRYCQRTLPEDSRGFEQLVAQYKGLVFKTAYRLMGNRTDADDQAQEVFLKIYRQIKQIDDPHALTTWVYRITVNTCLDALRKEKRRQSKLAFSPDAAEEHASSFEIPDPQALTPEETALRHEAARCLEETWAKLEPPSRALLALREIEERSYDEIAKILEAGLSAVKMRIHRARLLFKQLLDQTCPELFDRWAERFERPKDFP